ncbi:hypothetical protein [Polaribacter sp.]|uniref:hypothetical protein n=1 Tax=Polaribacter sp. TaxID=1920175 RepID=UPI003F6A198A
MKNIIKVILFSLVIISCDPVADMEANIKNLTDTSLNIDFVSSDVNLRKILTIAPNEVVLFQEGFDIGNTYLEPYFDEYDSIVIRNFGQQILKVYKPEITGRNIYDLSNWIAREPSKRFFIYEFEIKNSDIQ